MTLVHPEAPADGLDMLREVLEQFYDDPDLLESTPLADVAPENLSAAKPHRRYTIGLKKLAAGAFLDLVTTHGWRYLLLDDDRAVGELELSEATADGALLFHSLTMGQIPAGCLSAHTVAERLPQVEKADYELRLLESPALPFCALWLHAADDDLFVPVTPLQLDFDPEKAYTADELQPHLQQLAKQTQELHQQTFEALGPLPPRPRTFGATKVGEDESEASG